MIASFLIHYPGWKARASFWGLPEMAICRKPLFGSV